MFDHWAEKHSFKTQSENLLSNAKDHTGLCHVVAQGTKGMPYDLFQSTKKSNIKPR